MTTLHPTTTSAGPAAGQAATVVEQAHGTPEAIRYAYAKAYERAGAAKLVGYKNADGSFDVPSSSTPGDVHTVTITGRRWYDLACTCRGGNHIACQHRAVVVHGRKYGVWAVRPASADASTPEDVALSEQIKREVLAELIAAPIMNYSGTMAETMISAQARSERIAGYRSQLASGTDIWG